MSPKSTRLRDSRYCPGRPASVPLRHAIASSAQAAQHSHKWLDGVSDVLAVFLRRLREKTPLRHYENPPGLYAYRGLPAFAPLSLAGSD